MNKSLRLAICVLCILAMYATAEAQTTPSVSGVQGPSMVLPQARSRRHHRHRQLTTAERAKLTADKQAVAADAKRVRADQSAGNTTRLKADEIQLHADMRVLRGDYRLFSQQGTSRGGRNVGRSLNRHHAAAPPAAGPVVSEADGPAQG